MVAPSSSARSRLVLLAPPTQLNARRGRGNEPDLHGPAPFPSSCMDSSVEAHPCYFNAPTSVRTMSAPSPVRVCLSCWISSLSRTRFTVFSPMLWAICITARPTALFDPFCGSEL